MDGTDPVVCIQCEDWIRTIMANRERLAAGPARRVCADCGLILLVDDGRPRAETALEAA